MGSAGHAPFSPSASARWLRCPGSATLSYGIVEPKRDNTAAMLGTRVHLVAERALKRQPLPQFGEKEAKLAAPFVDHVNKLARSRRGRIHVWAEEKISILSSCWGTADAVVYAPEEHRLDIVDLKTGKNPVSPDATQLRLYAAGALHSFPTAREICGWIVQPTVYDEPKFAVYDTWELLGLLTLAKGAIDKGTRNPMENLHPGGWCRYCPARHICPAVKSELLKSIPEGNLDDGTDYTADFD